MTHRVVAICALKDRPRYKDLDLHLTVLKRKGLLTVCYSTELADDAELTRAIDEADMLLVLLTPALVNSSQWTGVAMQQAKAARDKRSIPVIPIFVEQCALGDSWLRDFQGLPTSGKPLSSHADAFEAWAKIVEGLHRALTHRQPRSTHAPAIAQPSVSAAPALTTWDLAEVRLAYRKLEAYHAAMLRLVDAAQRAAEQILGPLEHHTWQPGVLLHRGRSAALTASTSVDHIPLKRVSYTWASSLSIGGGHCSVAVVHNGDDGLDRPLVSGQAEPGADGHSTMGAFVTYVVRSERLPSPGWEMAEGWLASAPGFSPTHWEDGEVHVGDLGDITLRFGGFTRDMALLLSPQSDEGPGWRPRARKGKDG
jgi:hypothetical protein